MRVIAKSSLKRFWERPGCADARGPLHNWYEEALEAKWRRPQDIKFRMEQEGLTPRDLEPFIGPSGRVSEVLNRKRPLSLRMVKRLHDGLKIPYESLLVEVS